VFSRFVGSLVGARRPFNRYRSVTESLPGGAGQYTIEVSWLERPAGLTSPAGGTRRRIGWTVDLL